jgi:hypothetical protein
VTDTSPEARWSSDVTFLRTYVVGPRTKVLETSVQIPTYDAEDVKDLLNYDDHELMLDQLVGNET